MPRLAVIDLGSNTARIVIYDYQPGTSFRFVDELRETVRLGEGLATTGKLSEAAVGRALLTLRTFTRFARGVGAERIVAAATSASRDASNGLQFLALAREIVPELQVLSGNEEAELGVLAVANSFAFASAWVIDLGGGSLQISRMEARRFVSGTSFPLGAVRTNERFLKDPPQASQITALRNQVLEQLAEPLHEIRSNSFPLVAMGGTVRDLAQAIQKASDYPLDLLHGYFLPRSALATLVRKLTHRSAKARAQIPGISSDRADVIAAGALTYLTILEATEQEGLYVSGSGIREGLLYRELFPFPHLVPEVRSFTVQLLAERYLEPSPHPARVQNLAEKIFDGLAPLHLLTPAAKRLLLEAAYLSEIGNHISPYQSHLHSEYLLTAQPLPGFSHQEQAALALLVRYQHKGTPKLGAFARLGYSPGSAQKLLQLAVILRLAQSLERVKAGRVQQIQVNLEPGVVKIEVSSNEGLELELWEARKHSELFKTAFGQSLKLRAVIEPVTTSENNKQTAQTRSSVP